MENKRYIPYAIGIHAVIISVLGLVLLFISKPVSLTIGIIVICLSLVCGLVLLDISSVLYLMLGIIACISPSPISGIICLLFSIAIAVINPFIDKKLSHKK